MVEFYAWHWAARSIITFLFALCVLSQTLALVSGFFRHRPRRSRLCENLLELPILCQILVSSMMHGQIVQAYESGIVLPAGYEELRLIVFAFVILLVAIVVIESRNFWHLLIVPAAGVTLPVVEELTNGLFAYLFICAAVFWFARGLFIGVMRLGDLKKSLSSLSVKYAIDSLHTGVMFCEEDGFILLANTKMRRLMTAITGNIQRNGRHFFGLLTLGDIDPRCQMTWFEGQNVIILPDGTTWMFTITELKIRIKKYIQLTASDISERWKLTAELQPQNEELLRRQEELSRTMENLHVLSRERETQRSKMLAHDILGERLTLLLRTVRSKKTPDYALLRFLSRGLLDEIKAVESAPSPVDELEILEQVFQSIGVEILVLGELPEDNEKGQLVAEIAREAVTNAVRHGLATQVRIQIDRAGSGCQLEITDNGHPPTEAIREGGGLSGMRKKVERFSGTVNVSVHPQFKLEIALS